VAEFGKTWRRVGFQNLEVDGKLVLDLHNYNLLWTETPGGLSTHTPVLYRLGRRVVAAWKIVLAADHDRDPWGGNANTDTEHL
jgi:hypothetical protein